MHYIAKLYFLYQWDIHVISSQWLGFINLGEPAPPDNRSFCTGRNSKAVGLEKFHCIFISNIPYIFDRIF